MDEGFELGANRYGKSRVRLMKIVREAERNHVQDWTVEVMLRGDFAEVHRGGNNAGLLATDTMKNTVYSHARASTADSLEEFARELVALFLREIPGLTGAEVTIASDLWKRLTIDGAEDGFSFMHGSEERQTTTVSAEQGGPAHTVSGLEGMVLLKTTRSGFSGFLRNALTTLPETEDRLLGTAMSARWEYVTDPDSFTAARRRLREAMLKTFAEHESRSVQHTLFAMGESALRAVPQIDAVDLHMPNRHCLLVDLSRFGQDNPNTIFVPTTEPHGSIEARVQRKG